MSIRLNAEKRAKIMKYIRMFLTDAELQEKFYHAVLNVIPYVQKEIKSRYPQEEMEILSKYDMTYFGWDEAKIYLEKDKKISNYWYIKRDDIDVPLMMPINKQFEIKINEENEQAFKEYHETKSVYYQAINNLDRKYEQFVNAAYSVEAVIEIIPWLQDYYGEIVKESSCKVNEETVKDILKVESKRKAS